MTPIEKAETSLNRRIERLQANLQAAPSDAGRHFVVQALLVSIGLGEALTDYVKMIGQFAQGRHAELKRTHDTLTARHADLLKAGHDLLARLKADPADRALRKEIERAQHDMAAIQKTLKRGANALQRETAPSIAMIDRLGPGIRALAEAGRIDALKRAIGLVVAHVRELYRTHPGLPNREIIDQAEWERSVGAEIDRATDFHEAYACAGYQAMLALDVMTMAVSPTPPATAEEATRRAHESIAARLKAIAARFGNS